jgi:hypothetical protein
LATRTTTDADVGRRAERAAERLTGRHDETRDSILTTEFWAMVAANVAILVAAAVADNLDAPRAWLLVAIVTTGYLVSRGLAKSGTRHSLGREERR